MSVNNTYSWGAGHAGACLWVAALARASRVITARLVGDMAARAPPSSGRLRAVLAAPAPAAPDTYNVYSPFTVILPLIMIAVLTQIRLWFSCCNWQVSHNLCDLRYHLKPLIDFAYCFCISWYKVTVQLPPLTIQVKSLWFSIPFGRKKS